MLLKITNIEDQCADLDAEVLKLEGRIARELKKEKEEREAAKNSHDLEVNKITEDNQKISMELKTLLLTFQEPAKEEDE